MYKDAYSRIEEARRFQQNTIRESRNKDKWKHVLEDLGMQKELEKLGEELLDANVTDGSYRLDEEAYRVILKPKNGQITMSVKMLYDDENSSLALALGFNPMPYGYNLVYSFERMDDGERGETVEIFKNHPKVIDTVEEFQRNIAHENYLRIPSIYRSRR